jgi:lysozyme
MKLSTRGAIDMIQHEGIVLRRYLDAVGVWTWGVGHTLMAGAPDPRKYTYDAPMEEVLAVYFKDMERYEAPVRRFATTQPLNQFQYDALTSFTFNLGEGGFAKLIRGRSLPQIADAMLRYNKGRVGGQLRELAGLTTRRRQERDLFLNGKYSNTSGKVRVYPVSASERPLYSKGKLVDIRPYFPGAAVAPSPLEQPSAEPKLPPVLKRGFNGPLARVLQEALGELYKGKLDWDFGPLTEQAVRTYQEANKLKVDGVVGPQTWRSLGVTL